jgi:hypothetical protein
MAQKRGPQFELDVCKFFIGRGWKTRKLGSFQGAGDIGDIDGIPGWTVQCKNTGVMSIGAALTDAAKQAKRAGRPWWCVIFKRRNHPVARSYVVLELGQFEDLIAGAGFQGRHWTTDLPQQEELG